MPEFPEIFNLATQLNERLAGRRISAIEVLQPKCLNIPVDAYQAALTGATLGDTHNRGKWILTHSDRGWLLFNLGMGGELLIVDRASLPEKRRILFDFEDGACLSVNFWWFGSAHFAAEGELEAHPQVGKLGPNALDFTPDLLKDRLSGARGNLKAFLLDQEKIAGIGNAYVHDILFLARLHPLRKIPSLSEAEIEALCQAIHDGLRPSLEKGGAFYEMDTYGKKGGFTFEEILIGYREGQPCPKCGTIIQKIKTGGTSGFICPSCQPLP
jgi:formamidopyrimidine-DNA glycosylase